MSAELEAVTGEDHEDKDFQAAAAAHAAPLEVFRSPHQYLAKAVIGVQFLVR